MTANAVVRARVDPEMKEEAATILAASGLTLSDAFRMMLTHIVHERALPFKPWTPNEPTIAAMRAARAGETESFADVAALMADLHAPD